MEGYAYQNRKGKVMKQRLRFDPNNKAVGISTTLKSQGRHVVMSGSSHVTTRTTKKTKKGCADLLKRDDEWAKEHKGKGFLSEEQRFGLIEFAGQAYKSKPKAPDSPFKRARRESVEEYTERLKKHLEGNGK